MASRLPALRPIVCVFESDPAQVRGAFRSAFPKARIGFLHALCDGSGKKANGAEEAAASAKRKPEPVVLLRLRGRRDLGRLLAQALVCAANARYTHLFLTDDPETYGRLLEAARLEPQALIEDAGHQLLVFPLEAAARLVDSVELDMGRAFETDFVLHWKHEERPLRTIEETVGPDRFHATGFDRFLTKLRFYGRAQTAKRPWS